jgi:hypothetical protein
VVGIELEGVLVDAFLADAEEAVDAAAAVGSADPFVVGAELELCRLWRGLDSVEGGEEGGGVDAVTHRLVDRGGHGSPSVC